MIYTNQKELLHELFFESKIDGEADVIISLLNLKEPETIIYNFEWKDLKIKKGLHNYFLSNKNTNKISYKIVNSFKDNLIYEKIISPGAYILCINIVGENINVKKSLIKNVDSILNANSKINLYLKSLFNENLKNFNFSGYNLKNVTETYYHYLEGKIKSFSKRNNLDFSVNKTLDKIYLEWSRNNIYLGRYVIYKNLDLSAQFKDSINEEFLNFNLEGNEPFLTQFKNTFSNKDKSKELVGQISLGSFISNQNESFSEIEPNFYEVGSELQFPILGIPINFSGYYTSQDRNRKFKSSYFKFNYDAGVVKDKLLKLVNEYQKQFDKAQTLSQNYALNYLSYINDLKLNRSKLLDSLNIETSLLDTSNVYVNSELDSISNIYSIINNSGFNNDSIRKDVLNKIDRYKAIDSLINKYTSAYTEYKDLVYIDSVLVKEKIDLINSYETLSYKDLVKHTQSLIPKSKLGQFITGLTSIDLGMYSKQISQYTQSNQLVKGLDVGYDIGIGELGIAYGKIDYLDKNGNIEKYNTKSLRLFSKLFKKQQIGLVYFDYSPTTILTSANNFTYLNDLGLKGTRKIYSVVYNSVISKNIQVNGEFAYSSINQNKTFIGDKKDYVPNSIFNNSAFNIGIEGNIPNTLIDVQLRFENTGKQFVNHTMPFLLHGTEKIQISTQGYFFNSFLKWGVEYNYLTQNNYSNKSNNTRWGFTLATFSKQYPSINIQYKPFSTFRAYNDTFSIPQKPILGSVLINRINYQFKKDANAIRLSIMYTTNQSNIDTIKYFSKLIQFQSIVNYYNNLFTFIAGYNDIQTSQNDIFLELYNKNTFFNIQYGNTLMKRCYFNIGYEMAFKNKAISRNGIHANVTYDFNRIPIILRLQLRGNQFIIDSSTQKYIGAGLELIYKLNMKLN